MTAAAAGTGNSPLSVQDALVLMQQAVRSGEMQQAATIGASAVVPLSIKIDDLALLGEIASGAEATVLYGTLNNSDVAVKRFKMHHSDDLKRFRRELTILASLERHPNIVPLLGARALPPDYLLVMPLAATTLHSKMYQLGWRPSQVELLQLAVQAAEGLAAVHAKGLVHRDIKPSNMLLSYEGQLWLSDFGLAASVEDVLAESTLSIGMVRSRGKPTGGFLKRAMAGTLEYMAPEVLLKKPSSQASDVYALAITINELATGVYPFSDCTKDNPEIHTVLEHGYGRQELAAAVAAEGLRPTLPKAAAAAAAAAAAGSSSGSGGDVVLAGLVDLLRAAWQLDPVARPTAMQLRDSLAALLQQAQQQQAQQQQQQHQQHVVGVGSSCDGASEISSCGVMDVDEPAAAAAAAAVVEDVQPLSSNRLSPASSAASDIFICDDSSTLASSTLSLLPSNRSLVQQQQQWQGSGLTSSSCNSGAATPAKPLGSRIRRVSSASTINTDVTGFSISDLSTKTPLSTEAANAAAAAAAAAAVPAAASLQGVLSLTAAAAAAAATSPVVEAGAFGAIGPREEMEDRNIVVQGLGGDSGVLLAAVFDGHRGYEAAAYAAAQLPRNLLLASVRAGSSSSSGSAAAAAVQGAGSDQPAADSSSGAAAALKEAFLSTDAAFWQEWQAEMHAHATVGQYAERYPGCTALAAVVAGSQLFVANAGDGRAVLSRGDTAVPLSRQHTADLEDERARVIAAGGTVMYRGGSWRVGPAALQVTRAIGDFDLKMPGQRRQQQQLPGQQQQQQQQQQGAPTRSPYHSLALTNGGSSGSCQVSAAAGMPVTAEPEVVSLRLSPSDQFLILGTDGLWDVIRDQEAVGLVNDTVKDPALCAKRLVQEALSRGSTDNVSAVVVFLQPKHTLEQVWVRGGGHLVPSATPTFYGSRRLTTQQLQQQAGVAAAAQPAGVADELMDTY